MTIHVKKIALAEQENELLGQPLHHQYLNLVGDMEVECQVRVGRLTLSLANLQQLKTGQKLQLKESVHEPLDILLHNKVIARGELMSHEDCFAIHITEIGINA
jgi:flagellar motor switch protein FliN/FliY